MTCLKNHKKCTYPKDMYKKWHFLYMSLSKVGENNATSWLDNNRFVANLCPWS